MRAWVKKKRDKACGSKQNGFWCSFWEYVRSWQGGDNYADSGPDSEN